MGKAGILNNIILLYDTQGNYSEALICLEKVFQTLMPLGLSDFPNVKNCKNNIEDIKYKTN
ncbi:MAG: hypothetical protein ACFFAN_18290 [Promethearchaeota archaeon]